ncbi:hypothetical protein [Thermotalea metallivorans]|uniref:hypothetical protein n=1 Tax=Thermotalea metallivorans TaxID=520762 RepID=UPI0008398575|nr:hypothetical protein [Thermotalea metallivorans]
MVQIQSLMRAVINFYSFNNGNAPLVITRVKEHNSENMFMARLERAIFDSCEEDCKATPSRYAIWGEDIRSLSISAVESIRALLSGCLSAMIFGLRLHGA